MPDTVGSGRRVPGGRTASHPTLSTGFRLAVRVRLLNAVGSLVVLAHRVRYGRGVVAVGLLLRTRSGSVSALREGVLQVAQLLAHRLCRSWPGLAARSVQQIPPPGFRSGSGPTVAPCSWRSTATWNAPRRPWPCSSPCRRGHRTGGLPHGWSAHDDSARRTPPALPHPRARARRGPPDDARRRSGHRPSSPAANSCPPDPDGSTGTAAQQNTEERKVAGRGRSRSSGRGSAGCSRYVPAGRGLVGRRAAARWRRAPRRDSAVGAATASARNVQQYRTASSPSFCIGRSRSGWCSVK